MGLLRAEIVEIMSYMQRMNSPSVCMVGYQDIYVEKEDIKELFDAYNFDYKKELLENIEKNGKVDACALFLTMGAKEVHTLDCSAYEGADIIFDLNCENLPEELKERFDLAIDGGVLEHVFHAGIALSNISDMVKEKGYIYHMVPCAGFVNHGFYNFSPIFFQEYYSAKGFKIDNLRMQYKPEHGIYKFVFYSMDCRLFKSVDGINKYIHKYWNNGGEILLQCIAHKCRAYNSGESQYIPIQDIYQKMWGTEA